MFSESQYSSDPRLIDMTPLSCRPWVIFPDKSRHIRDRYVRHPQLDLDLDYLLLHLKRLREALILQSLAFAENLWPLCSAPLSLCLTSLSKKAAAFHCLLHPHSNTAYSFPFFPAICHHHFTHLISQRVVADVITTSAPCGH